MNIFTHFWGFFHGTTSARSGSSLILFKLKELLQPPQTSLSFIWDKRSHWRLCWRLINLIKMNVSTVETVKSSSLREKENVEPAKVFLQKVVARRRSSQIRRLLRPFNEKCRPILSTPHLKTFHVSRMTAYFAFFQHPKKSSFCPEPVKSGLPFLKEIFGHTSTSLFSFLWLTFGHTQHIFQQLWNRRKRSQD